ncbi:MAG TPA: phosphotransferase, partial [Actinopolymorphaceae bacterium]
LFDRWHDLAEAPEPLHPSLDAHLDDLAAMSARVPRFVTGETLVHYDVRADNVLITPDRRVVFVDWAWPCRADPAVDVLLASMDIPVSGSAVDPDALLARHPVTREVDPDDLTALLATFVGTFVSAARRPAPPGLPTIRGFQRHVADALTTWLCRRMSW